MPSYGGGKAKIGREIFNTIKRVEDSFYGIHSCVSPLFVPFAGFLGVSIHFARESSRTIYASDINADIIEMWQRLKDKSWRLPTRPICKKKYDKLRQEHIDATTSRTQIHPSAERGFYGIACAYSGIYFAGYRTHSPSQNFFQNTRNGISDMIPNLSRIEFQKPASYEIFYPKGCTIYCDPPYLNNNLKSVFYSNFDHQKFWKIMRFWSKNNLVFISEYSAPSDFICIWQRQVGGEKERSEKLFIHKRYSAYY